MTEMQELWQALIRGGAIIAYAFLYSLGGRSEKLFRRLGAPLAFIIFTLFIDISWKTLSLFALIPPLWFGYGGGENENRVKYALISGIAGSFVCVVYGNTWMALLQFILTAGGTTYLGLLNPVRAVKEEFLIAALSVSAIAFCV